MQSADRCLSTREKVLAKASEVFAERGFRRATVREIAARAGANLNAVNYYFGDKEGLYRAVLETAYASVDQDEDLGRAREAQLPADVRLRAFVSSFLKRALTGSPAAHLGTLMTKEMSEPTDALEMVIERFIRPRFQLLNGIVRELAGESVSQRRIDLCTQSIVAQCVHLVNARPIVKRLLPHVSYAPEDLEFLTQHVTEFSLHALERLRAGNGDTPC